MKARYDHAPVNGLRMYYEIHGEGALPLVLIHGGGSTIESNFHFLLPALAAHRQVIALELQAHGRTSDRDAPESFPQDADDVAALLAYLHVGKADILGFSNGATATFHLAIRHPGVVNKIVPISGVYRRDGFVPGFFDGFEHWSLENAPRELKEAFLAVTPDTAKFETMMEKDVQRMRDFKDLSDDELGSIKCPAMIVSADRDFILPEHSLRMARLITGSRLVILPGTHGEVLGSVETKSGKGQSEILARLAEAFFNGNHP